MTDPNGYPEDTDHSAISDKRMDANLALKKDNKANTRIKEAEMQRILSRTIEPPQQKSDDPRRGGRVGSDVKESGSAEVTEISYNHERDNITETKIPGDAIRTSADRLKSAEDAVVTVIRNLSKKGYDFLSNLIKKDYGETNFEIVRTSESKNTEDHEVCLLGNTKTSNLKDLNVRGSNSNPKDRI